MPKIPAAPWTIDDVEGRFAEVAAPPRHLSDLPGLFRDIDAFERMVADRDPLVYTVSSVENDAGGGALSFGLGRIEPGVVGDEYFMTRGHAHARKEAAEVYVGLAGTGLMLLHELATGQHRAVRLAEGDVVYVPGGTAHRTVNIGDRDLQYLGIYPSDAGHDYQAVVERPFPHRVVVDSQHGWRLDPPAETR